MTTENPKPDKAPVPAFLIVLLVLVALAFALYLSSSIGADDAPAPAPGNPVIDAYENAPTVAKPRFDPSKIEAARAAIAEEPKVVDLLFDQSNVIEWHVAVADDGTRRYGYAGYICQLLRKHGAYDENVEVRIVDAAKRGEFGDAFRDYSLGAVRCSDDSHFD